MRRNWDAILEIAHPFGIPARECHLIAQGRDAERRSDWISIRVELTGRPGNRGTRSRWDEHHRGHGPNVEPAEVGLAAQIETAVGSDHLVAETRGERPGKVEREHVPAVIDRTEVFEIKHVGEAVFVAANRTAFQRKGIKKTLSVGGV